MAKTKNVKKSIIYIKEGINYLIQGKLDESITSFLLGCLLSQDTSLISSTLDNLKSITKENGTRNEGKLIEEILLIYLAYRLKNSAALSRLKAEYQPKETNINSPLIIIAGSTAKGMEKTVELTKNSLIQSLKDYHGSIVSGGTASGISGIAGDLQERYLKSLRVIGYVPRNIPEDVSLDMRYASIHHTDGENFSIREPLQYWLDIVLSGIPPEKIFVLGVGGGRISSFEYRFAAILGIRVGIIEIPNWTIPLPLQDEAWKCVLTPLKNDPAEIQRFFS